MNHFFAPLLQWYSDKLEQGGYWLVVLLMAIESSIVPLPSELVIPPAAHLAHTKGNMTVIGVILAGTFGSWLGAAAMYWAARLAGRPLAMKYGRYFLFSPFSLFRSRKSPKDGKNRASFFPTAEEAREKIEAAELWSAQFGSFGIFFARLLPVVRHLIGIPAGIVRLPFGLYSLYTVIGSGLWCSVLAWIGIKAGEDDKLMKGDLRQITLWVVCAFVVLGGIYYAFVYRQMESGKRSKVS